MEEIKIYIFSCFYYFSVRYIFQLIGFIINVLYFILFFNLSQTKNLICSSKPRIARSICKLTGSFACDFPSLIGNSDYYGGLGGEFTISTRSETSGTIVLRHELGHNLIPVGEEYDGGYVYSGVNSASNLNKVNKWNAWLSGNTIQKEDSVLLVQEYPWYDLNNGPWIKNFIVTNENDVNEDDDSTWLLKLSLSGAEVIFIFCSPPPFSKVS